MDLRLSCWHKYTFRVDIWAMSHSAQYLTFHLICYLCHLIGRSSWSIRLSGVLSPCTNDLKFRVFDLRGISLSSHLSYLASEEIKSSWLGPCELATDGICLCELRLTGDEHRFLTIKGFHSFDLVLGISCMSLLSCFSDVQK